MDLYGFWVIANLNVANWQTPGAYLSESQCSWQSDTMADAQIAMGLSVSQAMLIIVISRLLVALFSTIVAKIGFRLHISSTVQKQI
jgi:NCS1 family nucleobase:cation symporter-1